MYVYSNVAKGRWAYFCNQDPWQAIVPYLGDKKYVYTNIDTVKLFGVGRGRHCLPQWQTHAEALRAALKVP